MAASSEVQPSVEALSSSFSLRSSVICRVKLIFLSIALNYQIVRKTTILLAK